MPQQCSRQGLQHKTSFRGQRQDHSEEALGCFFAKSQMHLPNSINFLFLLRKTLPVCLPACWLNWGTRRQSEPSSKCKNVALPSSKCKNATARTTHDCRPSCTQVCTRWPAIHLPCDAKVHEYHVGCEAHYMRQFNVRLNASPVPAGVCPSRNPSALLSSSAELASWLAAGCSAALGLSWSAQLPCTT